MKYHLIFLLGVLALLLIPSCTNGQYDPVKGNAFAAATTNPALTIGAPVIATAVGGPTAGATTAGLISAFGAVVGAVVGGLNYYQHKKTQGGVGDVANTVATVATAVGDALKSPVTAAAVIVPPKT